MAFAISYQCFSEKGPRRSTNQDNFVCENKLAEYGASQEKQALSGSTTAKKPAVFGVFDGMGGEERGDAAAYIAAKTLLDFPFGPMKKRSLKRYTRLANNNICRFARENGLDSTGTTSALLLFSGRHVYACNVGDSRIFRFSDGTLTQCSVDHCAPPIYGSKPPLMQYLGIPETEMLISPHIAANALRKDDIYLICSDGLTDALSNDVVTSVLSENPYKDAGEALMNCALTSGAKDNITLILIKIS